MHPIILDVSHAPDYIGCESCTRLYWMRVMHLIILDESHSIYFWTRVAHFIVHRFKCDYIKSYNNNINYNNINNNNTNNIF